MERRAAFVLLGMLYLAVGTLVTVQAGESLSLSLLFLRQPLTGLLFFSSSFDRRPIRDDCLHIPCPRMQ